MEKFTMTEKEYRDFLRDKERARAAKSVVLLEAQASDNVPLEVATA
jgi:uncharacterized ferredoxin-like protein